MDWLSQYSAALDERDSREQAHETYINAYTKLANKSASTTDRSQTQHSTAPPVTKASDSEAVLAHLRTDLAATQKARSALQAQVAELTTSLKTLGQQNAASTQQTALLTKQKLDVERRLRDRDEELRGKTKLAETAQDEMIALGLQLNLAEEKMAELKRENAELIERYMQRVGQEAETMNRDSQWE